MEINGLIIDATGEEIITELRDQLLLNGIELFSSVKPGVNNIQFSCPSHKNGQERKPSCGMSLTTTYSGGKPVPPGTIHCFTCGYTTDLPNMISDCFGKQDGGIFGNAWLKKNFTSSVMINRPELKLNTSRTRVKQEKKKVVIPESILDTYRYTHPYMYKRGLTDEVIEMFDVGYDRERQCLTFPVKDLDGDVVFIQTRSVNTKFHHYAQGVSKTDYIYGAYEAIKYSKSNKIVITESIINSLTLWTQGIPSVALMGTGGGNQYEILKMLPFRHYVIGTDPDEAGVRACNKLIRNLSNKKVLSKYVYPDSTRDINDLKNELFRLKEVLL